MNEGYGAFNLDAFNGYQGAVSTSCMQQTAQRFLTNNGPCSDSYDPSRMLDQLNRGTYNSTMSGTPNRASAAQHAMMPASAATQQNGLRIPGVVDFEPIPLSAATIRRLNHHPSSHPHFHQTHHSHQLTMIQGVQRPAVVSATNTITSPDVPTSQLDSFICPPKTQSHHVQKQTVPRTDVWLQDIKMEISGLSLEPLSGSDVFKRVETRSEEVLTRYLPCVDFLVQCQQDLRKGLAAATAKRVVHHMFRDAMTPRQFFNSYIANLPEKFYRKNKRTMKADDLSAATKELQKLCADAKASERQGCEVVKNTFLGGMKDGESWGLRKWLSKHGGALQICNDYECILLACQKLDRSLDSTRKFSALVRPLAKNSLTRLKADVPSSYQEHSSAHPYLPFFHRLEAALKGMSTFDPEDDDVICIDDDDEVEELKAQAPLPSKKPSNKRKASEIGQSAPKKLATSEVKDSSDDDSDDASVIEIVEDTPTEKSKSKESSTVAPSEDDSDYLKQLMNTFDDDGDGLQGDIFGVELDNFDFEEGGKKDAFGLAAGLEKLAGLFDSNQQMLVRPFNVSTSSFWDESGKYASALRLFSEILRTPESTSYLERVNENELIQMGNPPYSKIIRHPLCFRDIVTSLFEETEDLTGNTGKLPIQGLSAWNMWRGNDLLQAIDLVFLNSLAYGKASDEGRTNNRSNTNKLRKLLWAGIRKVIDSNVSAYDSEQRKKCTPTRRGEASGFVVHKER